MYDMFRERTKLLGFKRVLTSPILNSDNHCYVKLKDAENCVRLSYVVHWGRRRSSA